MLTGNDNPKGVGQVDVLHSDQFLNIPLLPIFKVFRPDTIQEKSF